MSDDIPRAYVALGERGLLKVGHTKRPQSRLIQLRKEFAAKGDQLARIEWCEPTYGSWAVERALIDFCRQRFTKHSGFEWFTGADFAVVKAAADEATVTRKDYPKPREWTREDQASLEASYAMIRAERKQRQEARKRHLAERHMRSQFGARQRARRIFDVIAGVCAGTFTAAHATPSDSCASSALHSEVAS
jgi:hypothetical protein